MEQTQLARIQSMERALNEVAAAVEAAQETLSRYNAVLPQLNALKAYYESPLWQQDYDDDNAGRLPADLARGVLTEDALYDLLCDNDCLQSLLQALCQKRTEAVYGEAMPCKDLCCSTGAV